MRSYSIRNQSTLRPDMADSSSSSQVNDTLENDGPQQPYLYDYQQEGLSPWARAAVGLSLTAYYLLVLALNYGVVHFEREAPDRYQTLVDRLVALSSWYTVVWATGVLPQLALLFTVFRAGLPAAACAAFQTLFLGGFFLTVAAHNEVSAAHYVYAHVLGTAGSVDEELVMALLRAGNLLVCAVVTACAMALKGEDFQMHHYCLGQKGADIHKNLVY